MLTEAASKIIAFRLSETENEDLTKKQRAAKVIGINSNNQLARKVVVDYLGGRLIYLSPDDESRPTR